jgi:hypothetical protein
MSTQKQGKRRSIAHELTEEKILHELRRLNGIVRSIGDYYKDTMPSEDPREHERRSKILNEARMMTLAAAMTRLRMTEPTIHRALLLGGEDYASARIEGRNVEFKIKIPKKPPTFQRVIARASVSVLYNAVLKRLTKNWNIVPNSDYFLRSHYVSHKRRYGESQRAGNRRRQSIVQHRTEQLMKIASIFEQKMKKYIKSSGDLLQSANFPTVTESRARQWVVRLKTPAAIAQQLFAYHSRMSPRQFKELLREAKRELATSSKQQESVNSPSSTQNS